MTVVTGAEMESSRSRVSRAVSRLQQPAWHWSLAFLLAGFYLATSLYISSRRLLWFDEIFTAIFSRLPDIHTTWQAVSQGAELIPPLYFVITRVFDQMFSHADIGLRVPSALALGAGLLVTFDVARRLTDGLYGLIAMSFVTTSFVTYYGYEARPYALCFMLTAIALWLWIVTKDESKTGAAAFGALFFIGVSIHYYFVLCFVPFGILALAQRRIFHPKVLGALAGVMCSLVVLYPQIANLRSVVRLAPPGSFWAPPSISKLQAVYPELFPNAAIPLVLVAAGAVVFGRSLGGRVTPMSSGERVSWLFLTLPLAAYVLACLVTNFFYNRYFIGAVPGIVLAVTCLLWRHCRESGYLSLALLVVFGGFGVTQQVRTFRNLDHIRAFGDYQEQTRQMLSLEDMLQSEGKRHFALTSNLLFLEAWYYSKHRDQYEFASFKPAWRVRQYAALNFVSVEEIVANARQTAIVAPGADLAEALERAGLHLKVRLTEPYVVYLE